MSFVRKPRPYSSGLPQFPAPLSASSARPKASPRRSSAAQSPSRSPRAPGSSWATAVTALAVLGTVVILLVGATGLVNQLWRDAQFRSAAAAISDVMH